MSQFQNPGRDHSNQQSESISLVPSILRNTLELWRGLESLSSELAGRVQPGEIYPIEGTRRTSFSKFETHEGLTGRTVTDRFLAVTSDGLRVVKSSVDHTPRVQSDGDVVCNHQREMSIPNFITCLRLASHFDLDSLREQALKALPRAA